MWKPSHWTILIPPAAWRVETERPIMDSIPDWLGVDLEDVAVAEEGEPEVEEEEQHQGQEAEQSWMRMMRRR
jgi:hypothetical protein